MKRFFIYLYLKILTLLVNLFKFKHSDVIIYDNQWSKIMNHNKTKNNWYTSILKNKYQCFSQSWKYIAVWDSIYDSSFYSNTCLEVKLLWQYFHFVDGVKVENESDFNKYWKLKECFKN